MLGFHSDVRLHDVVQNRQNQSRSGDVKSKDEVDDYYPTGEFNKGIKS